MATLEELLTLHPELEKHVDLIVLPPEVNEFSSDYPEILNDNELVEKSRYFCRGIYGGVMTVLALYVISRTKGNDHRWAAQFALQKAPRCDTNDTFWAGRKSFWQTHGTEYANSVRKKLESQGVSLGAGKEYLPELARFPGDKEAVVPTHDVRGHIRAVCEKRGMIYNSPTDITCREPDSDPLAPENCKPLGEDIISGYAKHMVQKDPSLAKKSRREIRETVLAKHGPSK